MDNVPHPNQTHGHKCNGKMTPEYNAWQAMKNRCLNPNVPAYKNYGGRGIKVCNRWIDSFVNFLSDVGPRPKGMDLDRINNDGNYEPQNVRWASRKTNIRNTRANRLITINGITKCAAQWAEDIGAHDRHLLLHRIRRGWSGVDLLKPTMRRGPVPHKP